MSIFIGIGGVSRAGKSTLAKLIASALEGKDLKVKVLNQDNWVIQEEGIPRIRNKTDWECPKSISWNALKDEVTRSLQVADVVILEGLFSFVDVELINRMDKKFYVRVTKKLFKERKVMDLRWGSEPEPNWYIEHIWSSHRKYGIPDLSDNYTIMDGSRYFKIDSIVEDLLRHWKKNRRAEP